MAPASPAPSDDSDNVKSKRKSQSKSPTKSKKVREPSVVEDSEPPSADEEDEEEEEYEIEKILDAKRGQFPKNKLGYFVKWKNYGDEHNSWVIEDDAANATELIDAYWKERDRKKAAAKKADASANKRATRKSVGADDASEASSVSAPVKKRGRKSASEKKADKNKSDDDMEVDELRPTKKVRRVSKKGVDASEEPADVLEHVGNMAEHMHAPAWDHLIAHVDTVERADDGTLHVYFTLNTGKRVQEKSDICNDKFPRMLLAFYENNLRWKEAEPSN